MKRIGTWLIYALGALAVVYLALYARAMWMQPDLTPGAPIPIFKKDGAPSYS